MAQVDQKNALIQHLISASNFGRYKQHILEAINVLQIKPNYLIILVGGTNGKGSTCAYLSTILTTAGYKVGSFTSPYVFDYNERIAINNQPVSDLDLIQALEQVVNATSYNLGLFKTFYFGKPFDFCKYKIEIAVVEVGIGGRNDVTNLFEPDVSVISTVAMDHCQLLGADIETIWQQKHTFIEQTKQLCLEVVKFRKPLVIMLRKLMLILCDLIMNLATKEMHRAGIFSCQEQNYIAFPIQACEVKNKYKTRLWHWLLSINYVIDSRLLALKLKNGLLQTKLLDASKFYTDTTNCL